MEYNTYHVVFKKLISDSRCPKDVMCNRAGEAKVLLSIYNEDVFIEDKEITIDASGYVMEVNNLAFTNEDFKIYGINLKPYPITKDKITNENYELEIVFQPYRLK